mgnify:CR=1 FL=1
MSISRFNAVEKASNRKAVEAVTPEHKVSEYYGENVFNRKAMQKYLSKETYKALTHAIDNGTPIDREIANHVAAGMRKRSHSLHPLVSTAYRWHRREARRFRGTRW